MPGYFVPESAEAVRAFLEAEDIAFRAGQTVSSAHLLLAFFTFSNRAQVLLGERGLDEDTFLDAIRVVEDESERVLVHVRERARDIAHGAGGKDVDCLHILVALTRLRDCFAYRLLERTGTSVTGLRNIAVSYITGNMPRRYRTIERPSISQAPIVRTGIRERILEQAEPIRSTPEPTAPPELAEDDEFAAIAPAVEEASKPASPQSRATPSPSSTTDIAELAPALAACGYDMTERARQGGLDPAIGRDREIDALVDILGKRRANNPVLVGPPGVGKTAIVEGLAVNMVSGQPEAAYLAGKILFALDTGALVAGTSLRGAFSERLGAIKEEVARAGGKIIVFIDEVHTIIGAGSSGEGAHDAANELKTALARGEFPCIGATTHEEYKKYIEKDAALERRFSPVYVEEPSADEAILIVEGAIEPYAKHHGVTYSLDSLHAAVRLSHRFITERKLPDKCFAVLDLAGARTRRRGATTVERMDVAQVIHDWSKVPLERLAEADADRFNRAEELIGERFIGHQSVVNAVCSAVRRGFAGFQSRRPVGSFLFLGPTGVGKTELVKVLAEFLFGDRDAVVRTDMSELSEAHSVARLIGAQPGYVGYEEGGQLTEALRKRPFQIVLFDEIEKAHKDVLNLLLQILDEGRLTDARGRKVSFVNTVVVLTSNLGADAMGSSGGAIGFGGNTEEAVSSNTDAVLEAAQRALSPELWGRLDERLVFDPLSREQVRDIAALQMQDSGKALFAEREISLSWPDTVLEYLLDHGGFSPSTGARGMRQSIQRHVEGPISELILAGELHPGDRIAINLDDPSELGFQRMAESA